MEERVNHNLTFYIPIPPHMRRRDFLYIPTQMLPLLKEVINSKMVYFHAPNGDVYELIFETVQGSFIGFGKLIERLSLSSFFFLFLQYVGNSGFLLSVVNCACVEVEYPTYADYFTSVFENFPFVPERKYVNESAGYSIIDDVNGSVLTYNSDMNTLPEIHVLFDCMAVLRPQSDMEVDQKYENIYSPWKSGSNLILILCERMWSVTVIKILNKCFFGKGWTSFLQDLEIQLGDLCVLKKASGQQLFEVVLFRNYVCWGRSLMLYGSHVPNKFIQFLCQSSLMKGELAIPKLFFQIHCDNIPIDVVFKYEDSSYFSGMFNKERQMIEGLKSLFQAIGAADEELILFIYEGDGVFILCQFTVEFTQKNNCSHIVTSSYGLKVKTICA